MKMCVGLLCCCVLLVFAGCQTTPEPARLSMRPVVPAEDEQIIRDQIIILVDATGSVGSSGTFDQQKALVQAFTDAMPDGTYVCGMDSFAGVPSSKWVRYRMAPFARDAVVRTASSIEPLGSFTPMDRAIHLVQPEFTGQGGRGALLVFSDGKVQARHDPIQACRELLAAHGGELCIYTVQMGDSETGRELLQEMASMSGCGKCYDGATLNTPVAMEAMVREIFFGPRDMAAPPVVWSLRIINFDNDSATIAPSYNAQLDEAAAILKGHPGIRVGLAGHTDSNASSEYNQALANRRVNAVKAALVERGVNAAQLETSAFGEEQPAAPNDSPEHMHTNRRVELSVLE